MYRNLHSKEARGTASRCELTSEGYKTMRILWASLGLMSLALGIIGIVVPLMPTVVFVLIAAFCFARSSERLHGWLVSHRLFGPMITDWQTKGAIAPRAKKAASLSIAAVFSLSIFLGLGPLILGIQFCVLGLVLVFIWTRPSR